MSIEPCNNQPGWTPVYTAAESNSKECLELFLSYGADKNIKNDVSYYNHNNFKKEVYLLNSLWYFCWWRMLIDLIINNVINNKEYYKNNNDNYNYNQDGKTPLHGATLKNSKECLVLLLSHGAEVDIKDNVSIFYYMKLWKVCELIMAAIMSNNIIFIITIRMDGPLFIAQLGQIVKNV